MQRNHNSDQQSFPGTSVSPFSGRREDFCLQRGSRRFNVAAHYPRGNWRWRSPTANQSKEFSHRSGSPNEPVLYRAPPFFSLTPRRFHHNQAHPNFQQRHPSPNSNLSNKDNIQNWVSPKMWEDPWLNLLPDSAASSYDYRLHNPDEFVVTDTETKTEDIPLNLNTDYYSELDETILNQNLDFKPDIERIHTSESDTSD